MYDAIGNPTTYYNGTQYTNMTWEQGRNLTFLMMGLSYVSFEYNDQGIRTSKTLSNGTTYNYILDGTRIVAETWDDELLIFLYDDNGSPIGMQSRYSGYAENEFDTYWFEKNLQGDIIAVYNESGTKLVTYTYDAWGNFTTTYCNGGENDYALDFNPFRYRGYYYDEETGFYYLNSRYYDPVTGRFINPDNIAVLSLTPDALTDKNLYAYCDNNPVMRADHGGEFWHIAIGAAIGAIVGGVAAAVSGGDTFDIVLGVVSGLAGGALTASGAGVIVQMAGSAAIAMATNVAGQIYDISNDESGQTEFDYLDLAFDVSISAVCGALGGNGASYGNTAGIKASGKQFAKNLMSGKGLSNSWKILSKTAHAQGGEFVLSSLFRSSAINAGGTLVTTVKDYTWGNLR